MSYMEWGNALQSRDPTFNGWQFEYLLLKTDEAIVEEQLRINGFRQEQIRRPEQCNRPKFINLHRHAATQSAEIPGYKLHVPPGRVFQGLLQ